MRDNSYIELSRAALQHNLRFIRSQLQANTRICSVIKGNAYGHGIEDFVPLAIDAGLDHFGVFSADEAFRAASVLNPGSTLMIMGMIDDADLKWAIANEIEFFVFEQGRLEAAQQIARKIGKRAKVHLELETGMHRTGFESTEIEQLIDFLKRHDAEIELVGLCTHFAGAENIANYVRIKRQLMRFQQGLRTFQGRQLSPEYVHSACSAACINYPTTARSLVRIGILQYGLWPNAETRIGYFKNTGLEPIDPLRRVLSWKSRIMSVKDVDAGEFVGYGTSFLTGQKIRIATVPVGYSTGFPRSMSNLGRVLINGARVGVVGIVNMNMMIVDVTEVDNPKRGDEVVLIGAQGNLAISVSSFSDIGSELNYESLTRLPERIPRNIQD